MKRKMILTALLLGAVCLTGCGKSEEELQKQQLLKQEGMQLQSAGDYEGAIEKYNEALLAGGQRVEQEEIDIAYYKASALYQSGDIEGAIETYSAVLALEEPEEAYIGRGLLYLAAGDRENADWDLNRALEETEDLVIKGHIYSAVGDYDAAKKCYEDAKKDDREEAGFYLANLYEKEGNSDYAMILYEEYLASGKAQAEGYLVVARSRFEQGNYEEALTLCEQGIALGESGVLKNLMQEEIACYERLGDFQAAKVKAESYLEKYPEDEMIQREYEFLKSR